MRHSERISAGWLLCALVALSAVPVAAQPSPDLPLTLDSLRSIPGPGAITIRPRLFSAYGALIVAAMLCLLYVYRGRAFIVYWLGSWVLMAAALGLVSRPYANAVLGDVLTGLAMLFVVWSCGLMLLAAMAFPQNPLRWATPLKAGAATAVWFLVSPFVAPVVVLLATAIAMATVLLGASSFHYLRLGRQGRHAGAFLIGCGLAFVAGSNVAGGVVAANVSGAEPLLARIAAANVVVTMFIALGMLLLVFEDMTAELQRTNRDLEHANDEVKRLAITDPLTGCHNRRFFDEIERREMQRHRRYGSPLSVVFVDVNHFKRLNDTLGHDRGDDVLRAIGSGLRRQVRESDYVIRWGGDEFLLLLACGRAEAESKAAELKASFLRERASASLPHDVSLSVGVASVGADAETLRDAIRDADSRMYRDKFSERAGA